MKTCVDSINAKATDVESYNVDDLEVFQTEVTPKINQVTTSPASSDTSLDAQNDFLCLSGYMGTCTTLQKPVLPDEYYKFVLPTGASANSSYIYHKFLFWMVYVLLPIILFLMSATLYEDCEDMQSAGNDPPHYWIDVLILLSVYGSSPRISSLFRFALLLMTQLDFRLNKVYFHQSPVIILFLTSADL
jgi:hypothetical protein